MSLRALVRKELFRSRRNLAVLVLVFVVVPGAFAASSLLFQDVIPRDTPVAVVPASDEVTTEERLAVEAGLSFFATPIAHDDRDHALQQLQREGVYAVIEVPHGLRDVGRAVTFRLYVDGSMVPFKEPSETIARIMERRLDGALEADVTVERVIVGRSHDLSGYLTPIVLMGLVMLVALAYVPRSLVGERRVLDRIRTESSLEALVGAKLVVFTGLMLVPLATFQVVLWTVGLDVAALAPGTILTVLLTFVALAALGMAVVVAAGFSTAGLVVDAMVLLFGLGFSGLAYPAGYFSPIRKAIVRAMPTHHAAILARSSMLRELPVTAVADRLIGLAAVAVIALILLELSIIYTRRRT